MENYTVRKYIPDNLHLLKNDWQILEKGKDMSFFQTYDWYESINTSIPKKGEVVFLQVCKNEKVVLIAPLWILNRTFLFVNKRGVYFWGKDGYSDYLNFVYSDFDGRALEAVFQYLRIEYGSTHYYLEFLQENLEVVTFLENYVPHIAKISFSYAALNLPDNIEDYTSKLSKHTKQNLRTAHNRMIKDGVSFESSIIESNIDEFIRRRCEVIRKNRLPYKTQTEKKQWSIKTKIHMFLDDKLRIHFPYKSVVEVDKKGRLLLITCGVDIAAFFYFGYEQQKKRIVVMTAGTNEKYARYSPGFYFMYQQIMKWIDEKSVEVVDFTRGGEKYKFYLGCEKIPVCNLSFVLGK